jgi:hypothetical protein
MSNLNRIKNFKLNILQKRYKILSDRILKLEKHVDNLHTNNFLDYSQKNHILGTIFILSKNLNSAYNNYIIEDLDSNDSIDNMLSQYLGLFNKNFNEIQLLDDIMLLLKNNINLPLKEQENELTNIIMMNGYESIDGIIDIFSDKIELNNNMKQLIQEISNIFIPTKISFFDVMTNNIEYYWKIPTDYQENDLLELNRELWIKNSNTLVSSTKDIRENKDLHNTCNMYIKIEGFFINDSLSCFIKTSQINYSYLQKNKT